MNSHERYASLRSSDHEIANLIKQKDLHSLNLVGRPVTAKGFSKLKELTELKTLYLYNTRISTPERLD